MPLGYLPGRGMGLSAHLFGSRRFSRAIEFSILRRWLGARRGVALDLGCGDGEYAAQLALMGFRVVGLDLAIGELRDARVATGPELDTRFVCGDATRLPFRDQAFDLVLSNSVIEHIPADTAVFAEVRRVLKDDGQFILTTDTFPDHVSPWLRHVPERWRRQAFRGVTDLTAVMRQSHETRHHVSQYYTPDLLRARLQGAGLSVTHVQSYMNGPVTAGIFELHLLLEALDLYNALSRRFYPLFHATTGVPTRTNPGYGLAACAIRPSA
jgi:ubiquinone/menaquinone biosynthesis C-methylase UbiE